MKADVVERYAGNPILTPEMIPGANAVFNSSVVPFGQGYVGVFRVERRYLPADEAGRPVEGRAAAELDYLKQQTAERCQG